MKKESIQFDILTKLIGFLESLGFSRQSSYKNDYTNFWFRFSKFIVGVEGPGHPIATIVNIAYCGGSGREDIQVSGFVEEEKDVENIMSFLRAVINPALMPLHVNNKWGRELVAAYFEEH